MTIKEVIANKSELIELKKNAIKQAPAVSTLDYTEVNKALSTSYKDEPTSGVIKRTIIGNTYYWLDSHYDVHVGNTFKKSIDERTNKIFHLHDHLYQLTAKVGKFTDIYEKQVSWSDLGISKDGNTTVLMADSEIKKSLNDEIFNMYLNNEIDQHSVGMRYVNIKLAVNDEEYKEEYATWNNYINLIGNKEKAEEVGYFWAVSEAKLIEISAVLLGSNELTNTVENIEPTKEVTQEKDEPTEPVTQPKRRIIY